MQTYGFDGIRIDTVPEVPKDSWAEFAAASGVFQMGEVFNGNDAYVGPYQNYLSGLFNYPMYYTIRDVFISQQSMNNIPGRLSNNLQNFGDVYALGLFIDNHYNKRFLN